MSRVSMILLALILALAPGCRERSAEGESAEGHAAAAPDAMCEEHGVLEAVCTKCNPALEAVFRFKGDWCEEHGFPESFCPTCHPERGGRPDTDVSSSGDAPADGTKVHLKTKDTARLAGLRFARAVEQPTSREIVVTAHVVYDATRVAEVNPRMPGVVRAIRADVGTNVKVGAPLVVIESADVGAEQSRLTSAKTRLEVAEANLARVEALRADGISPERDVFAARREREEARAEVRTAQSLLAMVGAGADGSGRYTLTAPISGVVTQRSATIGRLVDSGDIVFEVVDPSAMWLELDIPEAEVPLTKIGQLVTATLDGLPGREFQGPLSYVSTSVDPRTRAAGARVQLANLDGLLRANLFGRARIAITDPRSAVLVPRAAVQRARGAQLVFVRTAEDTFEARRVTVGSAVGDLVSVTGRIRAADEVVTEGSFLLKTETLKESIGAGCCEAN